MCVRDGTSPTERGTSLQYYNYKKENIPIDTKTEMKMR